MGRSLRGDLAVWLIILAELLAFALLFVAFAVTRARHPVLFAQSQHSLDASMGLVNTLLLISGSACVVQAVSAVVAGAARAALAWLAGAQGCGAAFLVFKVGEYADNAAAGIDLETNVFYTFYYLLTGFHFLHVVAAMVFLAWLMAVLYRSGTDAEHAHAVETSAAFWHMVDLLWIVLFPLVYIVR